MFSYLKKCISQTQSSDNVNITSTFKPMYVVLTIFGLLPYSLRFPKGNEGAVVIRKSIYFNTLCSVSFILIIYSMFVLHVHQVFADTESNTMTEVLATKTNYMLELVMFLLFTNVSYFGAFKNRFAYVKMLNAIVSSSNKFHDHTVDSVRKIRARVKMVTGCFCIMLLMQLIVNFTRHDSVWKMVLVLASFILPQMIQFAVTSFYYTMILMIVGILKNVDEEVKSTVKARKFKESDFKKVEIRPISLRQMETVFVKLLETKRDVKDAFQACILTTVIQCFHSIVSEGHIIYHGLVVNNTLTTHDVFNCSIWIGYQLIKIYMISFSGNDMKEQVAKIGRSLHNIPPGKENTKLYLEVQHFSSLILYQNTELTTYNYFPVDATLMFNVVTSAVMYLVIFVQFDKRA